MNEFTCPECGSHNFGTSGCTGPEDQMVRHCHGYIREGDGYQSCRFEWPIAEDAKYIREGDGP